jgi:hypothetical protein
MAERNNGSRTVTVLEESPAFVTCAIDGSLPRPIFEWRSFRLAPHLNLVAALGRANGRSERISAQTRLSDHPCVTAQALLIASCGSAIWKVDPKASETASRSKIKQTGTPGEELK